MQCKKCGYPNQPGAKRCAKCGGRLSKADPLKLLLICAIVLLAVCVIVILVVLLKPAARPQELAAQPTLPPQSNQAPAESTPQISGPRERVLRGADSETVFGTGVSREQVREIVFLSSLETAPDLVWDVSEAGDNSVVAWLDSQTGTLYIAAEGGVNAPESCAGLFANYAVTSIDFGTSFYTGHVTDMSEMFSWCESLEKLDLSGFDTAKVTSMRGMFSACFRLKELNVSSFDTSSTEDMSYMFDRCAASSLDLLHFRTGQVTTMESMFACTSVRTLDLSSFDTSNVTNMAAMFYSCPNLTQVDLSSFNTSNVTTMANMFYHSSQINHLYLTNFDVSNVTDYTCFMKENGTINGLPWLTFFGGTPNQSGS